MARAAADMSIQLLEADRSRGPTSGTTAVKYEASSMVPVARRPLHNLQSKHTAVLGMIQISSGILSVGIGLMFAITQNIGQSLITLFRLSHMTGLMLIFAGCVSNQLLLRPGLLRMCLVVNAGCGVVSSLAGALIVADLVLDLLKEEYWKMEILELCVLTVNVFISAVLCIWFYKEGKKQSHD